MEPARGTEISRLGELDLPVQLVRGLPLLAMVPLFQLWFGTYFIGKVAFIAYGVGVLFVAGTVNAVKNVLLKRTWSDVVCS